MRINLSKMIYIVRSDWIGWCDHRKNSLLSVGVSDHFDVDAKTFSFPLDGPCMIRSSTSIEKIAIVSSLGSIKHLANYPSL